MVSTQDAATCQILVVEDDVNTAEMLRELLQTAGYRWPGGYQAGAQPVSDTDDRH